MNFNEMIKNSQKKETNGSKSKVPLVEANSEMKRNVDEFVSAKGKFKDAKATMDVLGSEIIDYVREIQDEDGFNGVFKKSYSVPGNKEKVTVVTTNRYSISSKDEKEIKKLLGKKFDDMISVKHDVKLKPTVFNDEKLQNFLMEAVGDRFNEFFETVTSLSTKENFDQLLYKAVDKNKINEARLFCKQAKPSVR